MAILLFFNTFTFLSPCQTFVNGAITLEGTNDGEDRLGKNGSVGVQCRFMCCVCVSVTAKYHFFLSFVCVCVCLPFCRAVLEPQEQLPEE